MCYLHTLSRCISLAFLDYKLGKLLEKCLNFASGAILSSLSTGSYSLAKGTFSKLHKIIPLPHKIWRQRSACGLTAGDLWDLSSHVFGETGKIQPVGALLGKIVHTHAPQPILQRDLQTFWIPHRYKVVRTQGWSTSVSMTTGTSAGASYQTHKRIFLSLYQIAAL